MTKRFNITLPAIFAVLAVWGTNATAQWQHIGNVTSHHLERSTLTVEAGASAVRISAITNDIIRVRLAPTGQFGRDFSWAVLDTTAKGNLKITDENNERINATTGPLNITIHRKPCRIEIRDAQNNPLTNDDPARSMAWETHNRSESDSSQVAPAGAVRVWQQLDDGVSIYGLGEKTGPLNKNGRAWSMWNTDAYGYGPSRDPIYKSIPFFIAARNGRYHGVFFDNPWRSSFDFGQSERNVFTYGAEGGELNYYVIAGPDPKKVIERYTDLTGRMEMPPKWTMGYHQCRYSYFPESRVRELAKTFREKRIPCDVIYFDIDYMDGYRCFTWNPRWFPDPKGLIDDLHEQGFRTVAIIDPAIKHEPGYDVYDSGSKADAWVRKPDGNVYVGRVWPGDAVFPDFTNPDVREWWANLYPPFMNGCGIDGIWNDMNEPADFVGPNHSVPLDLRHHNEGEEASHLACHNIYGMQMVRATMEGLRRSYPDKRPFAITRATYAGGQRYGATWTGDNTSNWEHLRMSVPMVLNLGVSGIPLVGPDIGGFAGGATPELYARWIQVGSLFPFARTHTAWGNPDQEPWSYGPEVEEIARHAIERRYLLMPYLYTILEEATRTGIPMMRPMWLEFPQSGWGDHVFMLGSQLLVVPIVHAEARDFKHWLPPGIWFDVHSDLLHQSGEPVHVDASLHNLPMFVRAGAIIPTQSVVQSMAEEPKEPLILDVWPFGKSNGTLYEDDGESMKYRDGAYRRTNFSCVADGNKVEFKIHKPTGTYIPSERTPLIRIHGLHAPVQAITLSDSNGQSISGESIDDVLIPAEPGQYGYNYKYKAWLIRMFPDKGQEQSITIQLKTENQSKPSVVRFDFDDINRDVVHHNDFVEPTHTGSAMRLALHSIWDPYIVLRRVDIEAATTPIMRIRVSTENAKRVSLTWSTVKDRSSVAQHSVSFDVVPDGKMREYTIDLENASGGKWRDRVYYVRIDFDDGIQPAEIIELESVSFEPRSVTRGRE